jgi:nitric oxide reductase large subunit
MAPNREKMATAKLAELVGAVVLGAILKRKHLNSNTHKIQHTNIHAVPAIHTFPYVLEKPFF